MRIALVVLCFVASPALAQIPDSLVNAYLDRTLDHELGQLDARLETWKRQYTEIETTDVADELLGYRPPNFMATLAGVASHLYVQTGAESYASHTRDILVRMEAQREFFPDVFRTRVEYAEGIPAVAWFRSLPVYARAYRETLDSGVYSAEDVATIEDAIASSVNIVFNHPEWSAMNRAMLRAESFLAAALTLPEHKMAGKWRKMAKILASDSIEKWEIEDASIYHPLWLRAYIAYVDMAGLGEAFHSPILKYYFDYFVSLFTPDRTIPEFGDGLWSMHLGEYYLIMERGAREYQEPEMKWVAREMFERLEGVARNDEGEFAPGTAFDEPNLGFAQVLIGRRAWADPNVPAAVPRYGSGDALDEIIAKKIVFRSGWDKDATYLMLNYKDEGYHGLMGKNYMKHILAVEEEKMHHGHSDENSICLFMKEKSVLLADGGYRPYAPSGPYGGYRADIFHNRVSVRTVKKAVEQTYFDVLRNSGAYNDRVRTAKIDFQDFEDVEYARTRLEDLHQAYRSDRTVLRHKAHDYVIVVDALKFFDSNYFTLANVWHTRRIVEEGANWFVTRIDSLQGRYANPGEKNLLVLFLSDHEVGTETEERNYQQEIAVYQGRSQYYDAGRVESFVTVLVPLEHGADAAAQVARFRLVRDDEDAVGIDVDGTELYGVKLDLDRDLLKEDIRPRYTYESGKLAYGPVETDADFVAVSTVTGNPRYGATNLVRLDYGGETLFDAPESQFFQVWGKSDVEGRAKWRRWDNY